MMVLDYAWWHGFYALKKRYVNFMEEAQNLIEHNKKAYKAADFPNPTGTQSNLLWFLGNSICCPLALLVRAS
jgi:hypothetical protein